MVLFVICSGNMVTAAPQQVPHEYLTYWTGDNFFQFIMGHRAWEKHSSYGTMIGNDIESGISNVRRRGCLVYGPYEKLPPITGDIFITVKLKIADYVQRHSFTETHLKDSSRWFFDSASGNWSPNILDKKLVKVDFVIGAHKKAKYITARMLHISDIVRKSLKTDKFKKKNVWGQKYTYKKTETFDIYRKLVNPQDFEVNIQLKNFTPPADKALEIRVCDIAENTNVVWKSTQLIFSF